MLEYILLNWALLAVMLSLVGIILVRHRYFLVKPSIIVLVLHVVLFEIPATMMAGEIYAFLPRPFDFLVLVHVFPLVGFTVSLFIGGRIARETWVRLQMIPAGNGDLRRSLFWLAIPLLLVLFVYLSTVSLSATGLYAIFADPLTSAIAREESLKLVGNPFVRYGYSFLINVLGPFIAVVLAYLLGRNFRKGYLVGGIAALCALFVCVAAVSLTGARAPAALIVLALAAAFLLRRGIPLKLSYMLVAAFSILAIPVLLTVLREGRVLGPGLAFEYFRIVLLERVLTAPLEVGTWYAHYAQVNGFIGVAGVPKLATLMGVQPVDIANVIGLTYLDNPLPSVNAAVGYVFSYYGYVGLISLFVSWVGLWLLDLALLVYRKVTGWFLLPTVTVTSITCLAFVSADYTTALVTHGFGLSLATAWVLHRLIVRAKARGRLLAPVTPQKGGQAA